MSVIPTQERAKPADPPAVSESRLSAVQDKVAEWIGNHPAVVVGTGVILGAALGWLVKRKK